MWLLWKKSSQVKTNNKKKDDLLQEINRLLFRIDKGKYAENLDTDHINKVGEKIRQYVTNLEYTTFTCDDNIDIVIGKIQESVKHLREALDGGLASRVNSATEDLAYYFDVLISGNFNALNSDDEKTLRQSSLQRGLSEKIRELVSIKEFASAKKAELSRDIKKLRLEKEELEDRLCEEDDDDLANDIDRQISANEEIIKTKSASFHSYSVCETRLESLYNYAKEACDAGEDQVRKVNAYLDMEKSVPSHQTRAVWILSGRGLTRKLSCLKARSERATKTVPDRIWGIPLQSAVLPQSAGRNCAIENARRKRTPRIWKP